VRTNDKELFEKKIEEIKGIRNALEKKH